ncbi:MAG: ABC transporter permease [Anaerolineae bacterium]
MTTYTKKQTQLGQLLSHKDLLIAWTTRIVKARYQQSVLGGLWAVLQPLAMALILTFIFDRILAIDTGDGTPYLVFNYAALVPWTLFEASVTSSVGSLVANMGLVSKIYFPREILPMAEVAARLVDFSIAYLLLIGFMLFYREPGEAVFTLSWLYIPVVLAVQICLILGIGFIGSALNVFYRDISHVIVLFLRLWFYATPIIYPVTRVPERFRAYYFMNPMAGIIESYRNVILRGEGLHEYFVFSAIFSISILVFGYWLFKKLEFQFADIV